ncbi:glycosidase [Polaribacter reichenbachii]|uniref:Glycosidase n=1 Tax=Polaribacter reichenbachii TaxID=996801 RepID=A0A1B8U748_9FLAO|nr:glycosidase [Polaribacter reichenbachii]APZ46341.1 glycosidase [Polaribacter reichenbachii]AUC20205.1 glycosidase [Polaribacter reichenbachii]OBY67704.1 glycosidase [Polaribacter reichenbachii]
MKKESKIISNGVMLNAYPDSIGSNLSDTIAMLKMPEFKDVFSLFYVLPTFFNSDLDRGFSIIDYNLNKELVSKEDLKALEELNIMLKFDIVLNHLSVASPQFKDLLKNGEKSKYKDFFINWNTFWEGNGIKNENDIVIPHKEFLDKLFMRKSGLPILKVPFPDGSEKPYWNTFYQNIHYNKITSKDVSEIIPHISQNAELICKKINSAITNNLDLNSLDFEDCNEYKEEILSIVNRKATYLGQMDVNAKSELVWEFYEETLAKVKSFGCKILRLDAFAYLHKEIGQTNFFNKPGTWNYLDRINEIAKKNDLILLPEIHAEYGLNLHNEVAEENYQIYDFFLPGLMIHTLETGNNNALLRWIYEIIEKGYKTVNMLGCHDGIPVLDLKGKEVNGTYNKGLLENEEIETIMNTIMDRGGRVKNLYDPSGKKISYYQINATFFSALGENEQKLLLARAIQMFMPGIPQVWYLDIFAGKNNYAAADKGGSGGHKEINRTTLTNTDIKNGLKSDIVINQLKIMRLRNTLKAFSGDINILNKSSDILSIEWQKKDSWVYLEANLKNYNFSISYLDKGVKHKLVF